MQKYSLKPICYKAIRKISENTKNITKLHKQGQKKQLNTRYILYIYIRENQKGIIEMTTATFENKLNGVNIKHVDPRMRFRNSADPIFVAYQYVDSQPISKLAASFVKESVSEIMNFVSTVIKG